MLLLAAFQALLARYTGRKDIAVGSPIANRTRRETEGLVGFFANTVVMRARLSSETTFAQLLDQVGSKVISAVAHQELPFEKLVAELQPERTLARNPLFQVMFVLQNSAPLRLGLPGVAAERWDVDTGTAKFDLTLELWPGPRLEGHIEYATDLFDARTIARMARHFETLLWAIVDDPERRVAELPLLTADERQQVLLACSSERVDHPREQTIDALFAAQVGRSPERIAVRFGVETLTYRALDQQANRLAHYLLGNGVVPGDRVGLAYERSIDAVVALLAILKAGAAYVPLDPDQPLRRLEEMLGDADARILLTERRRSACARGLGVRRVEPDRERLAIARQPAHAPGIDRSADGLAYVLYTSGSTGTPKGVAMSHRPLVNLIRWQVAHSLAGSGRTLQFASLGFDVSFQEIFSTWCAGGELVLIGEDTRRDPLALVQLLDEARIERVFLPFVALQQLAEVVRDGDRVPSSLREIITAGEQLRITPKLVTLLNRLPGCALYNQYGPTETHVATCCALKGAPEHWPKLPPIGKPIANARVYVLDEELQPVPIGVPGELCIGGDGLARGYLGRDDETRARFVLDPHAVDPGARMYRTGDVGRLRPDGDLEFLGRRDQQIKIRGYRVELGEVEAALEDVVGVREAAVALREDGSGNRSMVAYLVCESASTLLPSNLVGTLRQKLPAYMIPTRFVRLASLPLTPSGKLDRNALPIPEPIGALGSDAAAAATPLESRIAQIWAQVLGVDRVGVGDDFFALGGHSLLATQIVSRLRDALDVTLPLRAIFEEPTVRGLARRVRQAKAVDGPRGGAIIASGDRSGGLPLSSAQERLWFFEQLHPGSATYNMPASLRVRGPLDLGAFERSIQEIVRRHEILRTRLESVGGRPRQVVLSTMDLTVPVVDLTGVEPTGREQCAAELASTEAREPFDLAAGPLLRVRVLRLADEDHIALVTMHHVVSDAWSLGIFVRELAALYEAYTGAEPSPLPELPLQYGDFALWQREWLDGEEQRALVQYWRDHLKDVPILDLPTDRSRQARQRFRGATRLFELPGELLRELKALSQEGGPACS
jgi:amino acid adenylation domain-containing protein